MVGVKDLGVLITPLPGGDREVLRSALADVHQQITNLQGNGPREALERALAYLDWCHEAQRRLRNQVRPAELEYLVPLKAYDVVLAAAGAFVTRPVGDRLINGLVSTQLDERVSVLKAALDDLAGQVKRFDRRGELLVLDTNIYMEHPEKIEDWDIAGDLYLGFEDVHIIVPLVVVDELDKGKRQHGERGYRAGYSVAYIDRITREEGGVIRGKDFSVEEKARGTLSVEVLLDPPGHVRLPDNDNEIVDRTVDVQALAGRPVRLVTYDTGMAMRGRYAGLKVHHLEQPKKEPPKQTRQRQRGGQVPDLRANAG
ncbi:hypothetical protein B5D80_19690 [Micromonospora wenchangensis]|uniref:PIN domain-containing protein n=1 Tax=Micromonospora wenchangensis TaxID=1185415 RepID=A0A246RJ05_9ACTN|nr:hypothetical protein B5D80_19690 [Micromonospora wenchangensis]